MSLANFSLHVETCIGSWRPETNDLLFLTIPLHNIGNETKFVVCSCHADIANFSLHVEPIHGLQWLNSTDGPSVHLHHSYAVCFPFTAAKDQFQDTQILNMQEASNMLGPASVHQPAICSSVSHTLWKSVHHVVLLSTLGAKWDVYEEPWSDRYYACIASSPLFAHHGTSLTFCSTCVIQISKPMPWGHAFSPSLITLLSMCLDSCGWCLRKSSLHLKAVLSLHSLPQSAFWWLSSLKSYPSGLHDFVWLKQNSIYSFSASLDVLLVRY